MNKQRNEILANQIRDFLIKNDLIGDVRIYFNNMCYSWNSDGSEYRIIEQIKASDYFKGANDEVVSMTFEGIFYDAINRYNGNYIANQFEALLEENGYYYEFYNSWNLSIYEK